MGYFGIHSEDTYRLTTPYFKIVGQKNPFDDSVISDICLQVYTNSSPGVFISSSLISRDGRTISSADANFSYKYAKKVPMFVEMRWEITLRATAEMSKDGMFQIQNIAFADCEQLSLNFTMQLILDNEICKL